MFVRFPIPDRNITSDERALSISRCIINAIGEGNKVLVHCFGGKGRTGTIIGLVLKELYSIDYDTTIHILSTTFENRKDKGKTGKISMPQTKVQFEQIKRN